MSYEIGTSIDLTHINKRAIEVPQRSTKSLFETSQEGHTVGTSFKFRETAQGLKAAIIIPVAFA